MAIWSCTTCVCLRVKYWWGLATCIVHKSPLSEFSQATGALEISLGVSEYDMSWLATEVCWRDVKVTWS